MFIGIKCGYFTFFFLQQEVIEERQADKEQEEVRTRKWERRAWEREQAKKSRTCTIL